MLAEILTEEIISILMVSELKDEVKMIRMRTGDEI